MTEEQLNPAVARRGFIKGGLAGAAALAALGPLEALSARAAGAAPMAKVMTMTRSTSMPMSAAVSLSSATARMALPILVNLIRQDRATMETAVTVTITSSDELKMCS